MSKATVFNRMFMDSVKFNQPLYWYIQTDLPVSFTQMFAYSLAYNQPILFLENRTNIESLAWMFEYSEVFNSVINMGTAILSSTGLRYMFQYSKAYNQDMKSWNVQHIAVEPTRFSFNSVISAGNLPLWGQPPV
jgi:hypothetical protein